MQGQKGQLHPLSNGYQNIINISLYLHNNIDVLQYYESILLILVYLCYVTFMKFNQTIERWVKKKLSGCRTKPPSGSNSKVTLSKKPSLCFKMFFTFCNLNSCIQSLMFFCGRYNLEKDPITACKN